MQHQGVHYDTGTVFRGPGYAISTRPTALDMSVVRRELQIIRDDLHANAVRIVGSDVEQITAVAEIARSDSDSRCGSPRDSSSTRWRRPRRDWPQRPRRPDRCTRPIRAAWSSSPAARLTLFGPGLIVGKSVAERLKGLKANPVQLSNGKLDEYLAALMPRLRAVFDGPLTYASLTFEQVDWGPFDYVGVDHYREAWTKDRYLEMLQPFLSTGKPVIVTEFGMRTYRGAENSGTLGFGVTDTTRLWLHTRPVIGRFVRPRLKGVFQRDEAMQARELADTLDELEHSGVAGALLSTFVTPGVLYRRRSSLRPRHGLHVTRQVLARRAPRDRLPGHGLGAQGGARGGGAPLRQSLIRGHASAPLPQGLVRLHGCPFQPALGMVP